MSALQNRSWRWINAWELIRELGGVFQIEGIGNWGEEVSGDLPGVTREPGQCVGTKKWNKYGDNKKMLI